MERNEVCGQECVFNRLLSMDKELLPMLRSFILTIAHRDTVIVTRHAGGVIFHVE